jgi:hypothetical protein
MEGNLEQLQNPQVLMDPVQLEQIKAALPEEMTGFFDQLVTTLREALSYSLTGVFLFGSCIVALAVVTFFLKEIPYLYVSLIKKKKKIKHKRQQKSTRAHRGKLLRKHGTSVLVDIKIVNGAVRKCQEVSSVQIGYVRLPFDR